MNILRVDRLPQPRWRSASSWLAAALTAFLCLSSFRSGAAADPSSGPSLPAGEGAVWASESPIGTIEYRAGQGLRLGSTGINIGGYTTIEGSREEHGPGTFDIDGINFLALYEPVSFFRVFSEFEVGSFLQVEFDDGSTSSRSDVTFEVNRLYGEISAADRLNFRVGKFLTPIGLWNPVPAEPFVWTTSEPLIAEIAFDEHINNGAMLKGAVFPAAGEFAYSIYGEFFEGIDEDEDPDIAATDHNVGYYLDYTGDGANWSTGTSFLASERDGDWSFLWGFDVELFAGPFELTGEILFSEGDLEERDLWGTYVQGVYEFLPKIHWVGRYEYFDPAGSERSVNLFDVGLAWTPRHYLLIKADYLIADHSSEIAVPGFRASFSLIF